MLKKILKSVIKEALHRKHGHSSDAWKHRKHEKYSNMGHHYYKRKHRSGSFFSSSNRFHSS